jgi:hypothetical protein
LRGCMDNIDRAVSLTNELYKYHPCGGPLHIVTDDGNLENDNIRYCWDELFLIRPTCAYARETRELGREILKLLARMNYADRIRYYSKLWNQTCDIEPFELGEEE